MADVTSRLRLVVDSTGVDKAGRKLKDLRKGARDADTAAARLRSTFAGLAGVLGAAFSTQQLVKVADQYRGVQNQLRLVTGSASELLDVQRKVLGVANETGASLDSTVRLYANLERFAGEFLKTQQDTLDLTRAINQTAVISGASVTEAGNAVRQLSQAIAGGVLRAEEFNSIIENMPRLGEAVAAGLGVSIGGLRKQVNEGLVTSEKLISALQSQFDVINQEFLGSAKTIGQALQVVGNMITVELGQRLQGVQSIAIKALQTIGANIDSIIKAVEGLSIALGALAVSSLISFATSAAASIQAWFAATVSLSTAKLAAAKAEAEYNAAIASGTAIALNSAAAQKARAALSLDNARADEVAALAKIADARAAQTQLATNLQLIGVQRAQAVSQLELARGIAIATGARTQQAVAEANLAKTMAAGIATRKALAAVEAEIAAAQNAHAVAAARVAAAETAYSAAAATSATNVGFLGRAFAQLRSVIIGIGAIIAANPLGVLVVGITAAVSAVVIFRDEIAKLLFGVKDTGAVIQATFEVLGPIFGQAAASVGGFVTATLSSIGSLVSGFNDLFKGVRDRVLNLLPSEAIDTVKQWAQTVLEIVIALAKAIPELITDAFLLPLRAIRSGLNAIGNVEFLPDNVREQIRGTADALDKLANSVDNAAGAETVEQIAGGARAVLDGIKAAASATVGVYDDIKVRAHEIANTQGEVTKRVRETKEAVTGLSKEQQKAADALKNYKDELEGQRAIIEAARLGEHQERVAREVLSIRRQIKDISIEDARALAEQNVYLDEQLEIIREQRAIIEAPFENLADNLRDAIINGGSDGVKGLKGVFKAFIKDLKTSFLDSLFQPLFAQIRNLSSGIAVPIFGPQAGIGGANAQAGAGSAAASGALGGIASGAALGAGLFVVSRSLLDTIGLKKGTDLRRVAGSTAGGAAVGAGLGTALLPGPGTAVGAIIGASIGTAVGLVRALFGNNPSNRVGQAVFNPVSGAVVGTGQKDNSTASNQNLEIAKAISSGVSDTVGALAGIIGADLAKLINVEVGNRNGINIGLQGPQGQIIGAQNFANTEAGAQQAMEAGIRLALKNLTGGTPELRDLAKALANTSLSIEEIGNTIQTVAELTKLGERPLSQYAQAVKDLNSTFDKAIASAKGAASAENALREARERALDALRDSFADSVLEAELARTDSVLSGLREIIKTNADLLADDRALNGSGALTANLRAGNFEDFFAQALQAGQSVTDLAGRMVEFQAVVMELGGDVTALSKGFEQAKAATRDLFNEQVQGDLGNFLNGPADQLEKLLQAQAERAAKAEEIGADIVAVERLTALELRQFFQGLSDQALQEVQSFLGLFEEASASVARNLDLSRQDLEGQRDSFAQFAQDFSQLRTDFAERFVAASPRESLDILRARANDLLGQVGDGNASAAQALPQVLNNLVENARQSFGNTKQFQQVLDFANSIATQAEDASLQVVSETERQIMALDESNDLLSDIRDILASSQAANAFLASYSSGGIASSDELLNLIQQGAGLTLASNDNAAALNVTSLIAQSVQPIILPLTNSIDNFTQQLSEMPNLMRLQIENDDRNTDRLLDRLVDIYDVLDRIEIIEKQQVKALDAA